MKVVTVNSEWLRGVLKKAKTEWPKELKEYEHETKECPQSETGKHVWSRSSTNPFCTLCGTLR